MRTKCKRGATAPRRDAVRRARRHGRRARARRALSGRDPRPAATPRPAARRAAGHQRSCRARRGAGRAARPGARRRRRRRRGRARGRRPAALVAGPGGPRVARRPPAARLHHVRLASPQSPGAAALAVPPRAPHGPRPRRLDGAALPRRRAAALVWLARGPGRGDRTTGRATARLRGGVRDGDRVSPQQLAAATRARPRAGGGGGHAANARRPSLDPAGRDEQQLVGAAVVLGPAASHAAVRAAGRATGDRAARVPRPPRRSGFAGAAVPTPAPGLASVSEPVWYSIAPYGTGHLHAGRRDSRDAPSHRRPPAQTSEPGRARGDRRIRRASGQAQRGGARADAEDLRHPRSGHPQASRAGGRSRIARDPPCPPPLGPPPGLQALIHLDTSFLVDALTGPRRSGAALRRALEHGERLTLSAPVLYEWVRGARLEEELTAQEALFPAERAPVFGPREAEVAAALYSQVRRARQREFDLCIAACALTHGAAL